VRPRIESRAALVVATVALFCALGGTSYAVVSKINGAQLRNRSVAGVKLKRHTVNGADISLSGFPTVPSASQAAQATNALHANTAASATSVTGSVPAGQITGTVASASSATNATNATNAANAANATNATNATNASNADGHTFEQIDSSAGIGGLAGVVNEFGDLTLYCIAQSGTSGTVDFEVINSLQVPGTFEIDAIDSNGSHYSGGPVVPASASASTATTFDLPIATGAQVSFSFKMINGSSVDVVTGTFGMTLDNGCTVFGNAEES